MTVYGRFVEVMTRVGVETLRRWRREIETELDGASVELSEYQDLHRRSLSWINAEIVKREGEWP